MIIAYYSASSQFELTEDEFKQAMIAWNKNQGIFIPHLNAYLSKNVIWAGQRPPNLNEGYAREDGTKFIKQFGEWKCADNPKLIVDMNYYRSVAKDDLFTKEEYEKQKIKKLKDVGAKNNLIE